MIDDRSLDRSLERAARAFIEIGPTQAPEHAVEAALLRVQSTPQERDLAIPWRTPRMNRLSLAGAAVATIVAIVLGGAYLLNGQRPPDVGASPSATLTPTSTPDRPTPSAPVDYSSLQGTILMEHLGNAPDLSEADTTEYHPERRRLYFMEPATMSSETVTEFLPGEPATGKLNADVSSDGRQVAFMDIADPAQIWVAKLDGTGLRKLTDCVSCSELDPAFDPTGTKIAFVHVEGAFRLSQNGSNGRVELRVAPRVAWVGIRDLATGAVTELVQTSGDSASAIPEQPSWSPDGTQIVFHRTTWGSDPDQLPTSGVLQIVDVATGTVRSLAVDSKAPVPGDPDWAPGGSRIVFTNYPWSSMGSIGGLPEPTVLTVRPDGSEVSLLGAGGGASWMPDGRIVYMANYFRIMNADGTEDRPVNADGMDLSELQQGFAYIPHWIEP